MATTTASENLTTRSNDSYISPTSPVVVNLFLIVEFLLASYVTVGLFYNGHVARQTGSDRSKTGKKAAPKYALRILCIVAIFITIGSILKSFYFSNAKIRSTKACNITETFAIVVYVIHDMVIHTFLWLRQYVICRAVTAKNGRLRFFLMGMNWAVLVMCISLSVAVISITAIRHPFSYDEVAGICVNSASFTSEVATIWGPGSLFIHIILFGLFVFPLLKRYSKSNVQANSTAFMNTRIQLVSLMKRCLLITGLCIATDFMTIFVRSYAFAPDHIYPRGALLFNANLIVNVILIIFSFKEWRKMLFPWKIREESTSAEPSPPSNL